MLIANVFSYGSRLEGEELVQFTIKERIPAIFAEKEMVEAGALISYGTSHLEDVGRAGDMLSKVLRGENPAEIAIDQASRFELAVNLRTAKILGLTVPSTLLARADEVIE